jgi:hypothetical protein
MDLTKTEIYKSAKAIGLDFDLCLPFVASKYYALAYLSIADLSYKEKLHSFCSEIAPSFLAYSFISAGGELRHFNSRQYHDWTEKMEEETNPLIKEALHNVRVKGDSRINFWVEWISLLEKIPMLDMLKTTTFLFNHGDWREGFGGKSWGKIAQNALSFLSKEINEITFIDNCWGLQHNGGCFFNKIYSVATPLLLILDSGFNERLDVISAYLSVDEPELAKTCLDTWLSDPHAKIPPKSSLFVQVNPVELKKMQEAWAKEEEEQQKLALEEQNEKLLHFKEYYGYYIGDKVKVIVEKPQFSWGSVNSKSIGVVQIIDSNEVIVNFPEQKHWSALPKELKLVEEAEKKTSDKTIILHKPKPIKYGQDFPDLTPYKQKKVLQYLLCLDVEKGYNAYLETDEAFKTDNLLAISKGVWAEAQEIRKGQWKVI